MCVFFFDASGILILAHPCCAGKWPLNECCCGCLGSNYLNARRLKHTKFMSRRRYGGKLFHTRGPAALKLWSPKLLCIWYRLMQIVRLIMAIVCCLISAGSESSYEIQAEFHVEWSNNHWRWWHAVSMLGTSQSAVSVIPSLATCMTAETGSLKMIERKTCCLFILYPYISQKYD